MGKFKSWKYRNIFTNVATSTCLVGASAGLIFGVSAGTFKIEYMDLATGEARLAAANSSFNYYSQNIGSEWNMRSDLDSHNKDLTKDYWDKMHNNTALININPKTGQKYDLGQLGQQLTDAQIKNRYEYMAMVIDGASHSTMDRSFNQGLYNGIVNFVKGKNIPSTQLDAETNNDPINKNCARSFKPGADNTTEFLNIYSAVAQTFRAVGLAGFNHVSYLEAMGDRSEEDGLFHFKNNDFWKTAFLLIDGDVKNNQNVASVLFRSDQPGWMTGIATCMYFLNNLSVYHNNHQPLSVGAYGGTAIPTVTIYMGGVQRGIEFFNNLILRDKIIVNEFLRYVLSTDAEVKSLEAVYDLSTVRSMIKHSKIKSEIESMMTDYKAGKIQPQKAWDLAVDFATKLYDEYQIHMIKLGAGSTHFSGTFASGDAIGITKQYLNRGASAIIAVAGPQSLDTAQEIQNQKSNCIVIGVDSPMEEGDYQRKYTNGNADGTVAPDGSTPAQKGNIIKFSAVKDMTTVTSKFAELCNNSQNYDVEAKHQWEHVTLPEKVFTTETPAAERGEIEAQIIPDSVYIIDNNGVLTGIKAKGPKEDRTKYTICRIPEGVTEIASDAFKDMFKDEGEFPNVSRLVLNTKNNEKIDANAFAGCENVTMLDFSNVKGQLYEGGNPVFQYDPAAFSGISASQTNVGSIYLNEKAGLLSTDKDQFIIDLANRGIPTEWYQKNPDVAKSICNIGYKTCGNVENGLISISWDGWYPFMQAMQRLGDEEHSSTKYENFMELWSECAGRYIGENQEVLQKELGNDFLLWKDEIVNINKIMTYKTDSLIKKYYSHAIGIMGVFMKSTEFSFDKDTTVMQDDHGKFYLLKEGDTVKMTILDWLKLNMYLTN